MKTSLLVAFFVLILTGCLSPVHQTENIRSIIPLSIKEQRQQPTYEIVPQPPKIRQFEWLHVLQPLLNKMVEAKAINTGSLLLDNITNNTNGILQTKQATSILYKALQINSTYTIVPEAELISARNVLGLSLEDSLGSRSKAIALARILNAKYVLYSDLSGDIKSPMIDMQLMLVQTGEIIWSAHDIIEP